MVFSYSAAAIAADADEEPATASLSCFQSPRHWKKGNEFLDIVDEKNDKKSHDKNIEAAARVGDSAEEREAKETRGRVESERDAALDSNDTPISEELCVGADNTEDVIPDDESEASMKVLCRYCGWTQGGYGKCYQKPTSTCRSTLSMETKVISCSDPPNAADDAPPGNILLRFSKTKTQQSKPQTPKRALFDDIPDDESEASMKVLCRYCGWTQGGYGKYYQKHTCRTPITLVCSDPPSAADEEPASLSCFCQSPRSWKKGEEDNSESIDIVVSFDEKNDAEILEKQFEAAAAGGVEESDTTSVAPVEPKEGDAKGEVERVAAAADSNDVPISNVSCKNTGDADEEAAQGRDDEDKKENEGEEAPEKTEDLSVMALAADGAEEVADEDEELEMPDEANVAGKNIRKLLMTKLQQLSRPKPQTAKEALVDDLSDDESEASVNVLLRYCGLMPEDYGELYEISTCYSTVTMDTTSSIINNDTKGSYETSGGGSDLIQSTKQIYLGDRKGNKIECTSGFLRYFTEWAAEIVDTKTLQGAKKVELLLTYMDKFQLWGDRAIDILCGPKISEEMMNHMKSVEKQSDVERAEGLEAFKKGVESDYPVPNADKTAKVDVTALVGGRVTLSLLILKNDTTLSGESEGW